MAVISCPVRIGAAAAPGRHFEGSSGGVFAKAIAVDGVQRVCCRGNAGCLRGNFMPLHNRNEWSGVVSTWTLMTVE